MAEQALSEAIEVYRQFQLTRYAAVSACALFIYDVILTFRLEVKHIWRREFSPVQGLYCFIRYYGLVYIIYLCTISLMTGLSVRSCNIYIKIESLGIPILSLAVNMVLVLRLHALYHNRKMTVVLVVLLIAQTTWSGVVTVQAALAVHALPVPPEVRRWPGCFSIKLDGSPRHTTMAWAAVLANDSIWFGLTLYKLWKMRAVGTVSGLVTVFARDGAMFFGMICALELSNTLIDALAPNGPLIGAGVPWSIAGWSIAATRLVLSLREHGEKENAFTVASTTLRWAPGRSRATSHMASDFQVTSGESIVED